MTACGRAAVASNGVARTGIALVDHASGVLVLARVTQLIPDDGFLLTSGIPLMHTYCPLSLDAPKKKMARKWI
ncbi:hypothetical protein VNO77_23327 [Canavalia gladiata]|uniref:Uncharacterized protein n=1 Tax=Canavalia gladiata TaxID=3824 RepID=A0AAN9QBL5_CANGL